MKTAIKTICVFLLLLNFQITHAQDKTFTIEECVNTFSKDKAIPTKVGYQYWFADKDFLDGRTLKMSVVAPGKSTHAPHQHPEDEFFYVLEGKAKFYLDGKEMVVEANTSLYCPSNSMHGISNVGDTDLKYLVIKKYEKQ
ncbi:cupin domain-containing protein [Winogradskyella forsetii]|uniref:cupin domain-containing protein n=1 Tax=Winogradskyella forsetii TaxID=2686077 RepID=UPI0015BB1E31|nr:cupin domain-containing protein [Winogradskyella forsetii]